MRFNRSASTIQRLMGPFLGFAILIAFSGCGGSSGAPNFRSRVLETKTAPVSPNQAQSVLTTNGSEFRLGAGSVSEAANLTLQLRDRPALPAQNPTLRYSNEYLAAALSVGEFTGSLSFKLSETTPTPGYNMIPIWISSSGTYVPIPPTAVQPDASFTVTVPDVSRDALSLREGLSRSIRFGQITGGYIQLPEYQAPSDSSLRTYGQNARLSVTASDKVAICIHGILSGKGKFETREDRGTSFVEFLRDELGYTKIAYFEYNYTRSVRENGVALSSALGQVVGNTGAKVDVFAHSMGGLVSRWAIEEAGAANFIGRLTMFGTPNNGSPFAYLNTMFLYLNDPHPDPRCGSARNFWNTPGHASLLPGSTDITSLNRSTGYRVPTVYDTVAGNAILDFLINSADDGVVAVDSTNTSAMSSQSLRWHSAVVASNHSDYLVKPSVRTQLKAWHSAPEIRAELTWDTDSTDVDLHLVRPQGTLFQSPGDCYYNNRTPDWGELGNGHDDPALDFDDTNGFGAEHIVLNPVQGRIEQGIYTFYINFYSGRSDTNAKLRLWVNGKYEGERTVLLRNSGGSAGDTFAVASIPAQRGVFGRPVWNSTQVRSRSAIDAPPKSGK
jgi:pimeloyl-ACP methyl ester carboxylesterase